MITTPSILALVPDVPIARPAPRQATARELVARYATDNAEALAELLDACLGETASDRARALARFSEADKADPAAVRDLIDSAQDDLLGLPVDVEPVDPEKLVRISPETLDAAIRCELGQLTPLATLLAAEAS